MVVDLGFERLQIHRVVGQLRAQLPDLGKRLRVRAKGAGLLDGLGQILFDCRLVGRLILRERGLHLRQQVLLQELVTSALLACITR